MTITARWTDVFSRPPDQQYDSMLNLLNDCETEMKQSREIQTTASDIKFSHDKERSAFNMTMLCHVPMPLSNYAMSQVAGMAKIPTTVIERLHQRQRDDLVVENLNTLFPNSAADSKLALIRDMYDADGLRESYIRALNGSAYSRLWDYEVFSEVDDWLTTRDFDPKLPAIRPGAWRNQLLINEKPALFRGDQCSFGFFFNTKSVQSVNTDAIGGLIPGVLVWNSEVGARSFGFHTFYFHEMSGSIIIWTPSNHGRKRYVHRGDVKTGFKEYVKTLEDTAEKFEERFAGDVATFITAAQTPFANTRDEAIEKLNEKFNMPAVAARAAIDASNLPANSYGNPLSVWRIALGIAWEAGFTSRAESLVDETLVATNVIRRCVKVE